MKDMVTQSVSVPAGLLHEAPGFSPSRSSRQRLVYGTAAERKEEVHVCSFLPLRFPPVGGAAHVDEHVTEQTFCGLRQQVQEVSQEVSQEVTVSSSIVDRVC